MRPTRALRHRLEWAALTAASRVVPALSRGCLLALASILGWAAYHVDRRGRTVALENLATVFGRAWDEKRRREVTLGAYRTFARTFLDLLWSSNFVGSNWRSLMVTRGEELDADLEPGIFVTAHIGNFEWLALARGLARRPFFVVAQDFKNPLLTPVFAAIRSSTGNVVIPRERAMIRLLKHLKAGGEAAFLSDLTVRPSRGAAVIECFGRKVSVTALHGLLASRTGKPIVPAYSVPLPDGRYEYLLGEPIDAGELSTAQVAQRCWDFFEPVVREFPETWMWMYKHWRYLPADAGASDYPGYANRSRAFDRLLEAQRNSEDVRRLASRGQGDADRSSAGDTGGREPLG